MTVKVCSSGDTCDKCKHFELEGIEGVCNFFEEVIQEIPECCTAFELREEDEVGNN